MDVGTESAKGLRLGWFWRFGGLEFRVTQTAGRIQTVDPLRGFLQGTL